MQRHDLASVFISLPGLFCGVMCYVQWFVFYLVMESNRYYYTVAPDSLLSRGVMAGTEPSPARCTGSVGAAISDRRFLCCRRAGRGPFIDSDQHHCSHPALPGPYGAGSAFNDGLCAVDPGGQPGRVAATAAGIADRTDARAYPDAAAGCLSAVQPDVSSDARAKNIYVFAARRYGLRCHDAGYLSHLAFELVAVDWLG